MDTFLFLAFIALGMYVIVHYNPGEKFIDKCIDNALATFKNSNSISDSSLNTFDEHSKSNVTPSSSSISNLSNTRKIPNNQTGPANLDIDDGIAYKDTINNIPHYKNKGAQNV
jgi:hypothetical protein